MTNQNDLTVAYMAGRADVEEWEKSRGGMSCTPDQDMLRDLHDKIFAAKTLIEMLSRHMGEVAPDSHYWQDVLAPMVDSWEAMMEGER